jgi:hypothetical protein
VILATMVNTYLGLYVLKDVIAELSLIMKLILVMLVTTPVNVVTEEMITNVPSVMLVCSYIKVNVSTLAQMVIMLTKTEPVKSVTDLA